MTDEDTTTDGASDGGAIPVPEVGPLLSPLDDSEAALGGSEAALNDSESRSPEPQASDEPVGVPEVSRTALEDSRKALEDIPNALEDSTPVRISAASPRQPAAEEADAAECNAGVTAPAEVEPEEVGEAEGAGEKGAGETEPEPKVPDVAAAASARPEPLVSGGGGGDFGGRDAAAPHMGAAITTSEAEPQVTVPVGASSDSVTGAEGAAASVPPTEVLGLADITAPGPPTEVLGLADIPAPGPPNEGLGLREIPSLGVAPDGAAAQAVGVAEGGPCAPGAIEGSPMENSPASISVTEPASLPEVGVSSMEMMSSGDVPADETSSASPVVPISEVCNHCALHSGLRA